MAAPVKPECVSAIHDPGVPATVRGIFTSFLGTSETEAFYCDYCAGVLRRAGMFREEERLSD